MTNFSRTLVLLAMLSTASGWGLPSNDSLLSSNESAHVTGVDGARNRRQLDAFGPPCYSGCDGGCDTWWPFAGCDSYCDSSCGGGWVAMSRAWKQAGL